MNNEESRTDLGMIKIHKNVIASIAAVAAAEIEGVKSVGGNLQSKIMELIYKKTPTGVKVEFDKNEEVKIEIPLVIKYGYNIPAVSGKVQENVRNALEKMTSVALKDININIQGIERG